MRWLALALFLIPCAAHAQSEPVSPRIADLVAHLDADADPLHADFTPAVWGLCDLGLDAAVAVVPLLDASSDTTRLHASRVLECVVSRHFGWRAGQGYPSGSDGEARFRALWEENGSYAYDASAERRHVSALRWSAWLDAHRHDAAADTTAPRARGRVGLDRAVARARTCVHVVTAMAVYAEVTFAPDGSVSRVQVSGVDGPSVRCIERALRAGRAAPSPQPHTVSVPIVSAGP